MWEFTHNIQWINLKIKNTIIIKNDKIIAAVFLFKTRQLQELFLEALDRVGITKKITREYVPERFQPYVEDMIGTQIGEEMSDITRLLVEDNWLVPWTGMNPTNVIVTK